MTVITAPRATESVIRPVNMHRDLHHLANLIELCFADTLDSAGRRYLEEMRLLSRSGPVLWLMHLFGEALNWQQGYVCIENGRLIGNVGVQPAGGRSKAWLIANVAVHPEFRRRGIARELMLAAIQTVRKHEGRVITLQVDDYNQGAIALYKELGFKELGTFTTWERRSYAIPEWRFPKKSGVRLLRNEDWQAEHALIQAQRKHGANWMYPLSKSQFKPNWRKSIAAVLGGKLDERWGVGSSAQLDGWMRLKFSAGAMTHIRIVATPEHEDYMLPRLVVRGLRRIGSRSWPIRLEYPKGQGVDVLYQYRFEPTRTLTWMRLWL